MTKKKKMSSSSSNGSMSCSSSCSQLNGHSSQAATPSTKYSHTNGVSAGVASSEAAAGTAHTNVNHSNTGKNKEKERDYSQTNGMHKPKSSPVKSTPPDHEQNGVTPSVSNSGTKEKVTSSENQKKHGNVPKRTDTATSPIRIKDGEEREDARKKTETPKETEPSPAPAATKTNGYCVQDEEEKFLRWRQNATASMDESSENYPCCSSTSTQTHPPPCADGLVSFLSLSEWEKTETLCELVSVLDCFQLRLLASCVENAARTQASQLRQHELRANSPTFISNVTQSPQFSWLSLVDSAFGMVSLLSSANRQGAYALCRLIDRLMECRAAELQLLPVQRQREAIECLGKIVTASLHHPAFSIDQRIRLEQARDELRGHLDKLSPPRPISPVPPEPVQNLVFIRRFEGSIPDSENPDQFLIEMVWSDGERTFVGKTRDELNMFHHRLLDLFGEERREDQIVISAFSENHAEDEKAKANEKNERRSQTQSPLVDTSSHAQEKTPGTQPVRILPYFTADAPPEDVVKYIKGLSNLPARMMLSSIIYEEFHATRLKSAEIQVGSRSKRNSRCSMSPQPSIGYPPSTTCTTTAAPPSTAPPTYPVVTNPLSYGPLANINGLQDALDTVQFCTKDKIVVPTCSNCAEQHSFVHCDKKTMMDEDLKNFKLDLHCDDGMSSSMYPYMNRRSGGAGGASNHRPPPGIPQPNGMMLIQQQPYMVPMPLMMVPQQQIAYQQQPMYNVPVQPPPGLPQPHL